MILSQIKGFILGRMLHIDFIIYDHFGSLKSLCSVLDCKHGALDIHGQAIFTSQGILENPIFSLL